MQSAVTPVFLLAGIGALLSVMTGRLGRITDRLRYLQIFICKVDSDDKEILLSNRKRLISRAKFINTIAKGATFNNAKLREADFTKANLSDVSFVNADLRLARLFRANLKNANLTGAKIRGADLLNADLSGATWIDGETICSEGSIGQCQ